ncbi:hypothetical protein [Roseitalea porphyridii]|jgi:hypothetical protein|uniref:hypothetical protein n=1 Tax=Roseitalea porphyridii TaxID=1852022 RepID=UPI003D9A2AF3
MEPKLCSRKRELSNIGVAGLACRAERIDRGHMMALLDTGRAKAAERGRLDWLLGRFCGTSVARVERATKAELRGQLDTIDRRLARERNKGVARHWSYDLNRHIALKQARDVIVGALGSSDDPDPATGGRTSANGRGRRRAAVKREAGRT